MTSLSPALIASDPEALEDSVFSVDSSPAVLRVVVADDHALFRHAVCGAVRRHPGLAVVAEAADGCRALELIDTLEPDVALLDYRMPGLTGAEVCEVLQRRPEPPSTALLILSAFEDRALVRGAVDAGAVGYLGKSASSTEIVEAIQHVAGGGLAFSRTTERAMSGGALRPLGAAARRGR